MKTNAGYGAFWNVCISEIYCGGTEGIIGLRVLRLNIAHDIIFHIPLTNFKSDNWLRRYRGFSLSLRRPSCDVIYGRRHRFPDDHPIFFLILGPYPTQIKRETSAT